LRNSRTILQEIKKSILHLIPDAEVILFGSRARQDFHPDSDWDILILTDVEATHLLKRRISDRLFYIGLEFEICINMLLLNRHDWNGKFKHYPLHSEIEKNGLVI
jgi:predicted nucleotidyltransferase